MGGLFVRKGVKFELLIFGGSQERKRRSVTENVPHIIGTAKSLELYMKER